MVPFTRQVARAGRFGTKGLAITFVSDETDAKTLNDVQDRFEVNVSELPDEIDISSYSKCVSVAEWLRPLDLLQCSQSVVWPCRGICDDGSFWVLYARHIPMNRMTPLCTLCVMVGSTCWAFPSQQHSQNRFLSFWVFNRPNLVDFSDFSVLSAYPSVFK